MQDLNKKVQKRADAINRNEIKCDEWKD